MIVAETEERHHSRLWPGCAKNSDVASPARASAIVSRHAASKSSSSTYEKHLTELKSTSDAPAGAAPAAAALPAACGCAGQRTAREPYALSPDAVTSNLLCNFAQFESLKRRNAHGVSELEGRKVLVAKCTRAWRFKAFISNVKLSANEMHGQAKWSSTEIGRCSKGARKSAGRDAGDRVHKLIGLPGPGARRVRKCRNGKGLATDGNELKYNAFRHNSRSNCSFSLLFRLVRLLRSSPLFPRARPEEQASNRRNAIGS